MFRALDLTPFFHTPAQALRRPTVWATLLPVAVAVFWSMGSLGQPAPLMHLTEAPWQTHQADALAFALPTSWTVEARDDGSLLLSDPAGTEGVAITVTFSPEAPASLGAIERQGVLRIERDPAIARHFLRIDKRTRVAGRAAVRIPYTADLAAGHRVEALWLALPLDDGRLLGLTLTVPSNSYHTAADALFRRFIDSVTLVP